jgi:hypothetical protein
VPIGGRVAGNVAEALPVAQEPEFSGVGRHRVAGVPVPVLPETSAHVRRTGRTGTG